MRSLPMLLRMAEEMTRVPRMTSAFSSPFFNSFFNEPLITMQPRRTPWNISRWEKDEWSPIKVGKNGYQVSIDVSEYKPSELTVKTVDNEVVIEGSSEEQQDDHGYISRKFVRRFALPEGFQAEKAISTLSSDGILTVNVPNPPKLAEQANERVIPIQQTGPAHLNIKENPPIEDAAKDSNKDKKQ